MVLFRDFVQKKARILDIVGMVENMADGSVHVIAQGTDKNLEKLIECLHKGPFLARVARVEVKWREPSNLFDDFKIIY